MKLAIGNDLQHGQNSNTYRYYEVGDQNQYGVLISAEQKPASPYGYISHLFSYKNGYKLNQVLGTDRPYFNCDLRRENLIDIGVHALQQHLSPGVATKNVLQVINASPYWMQDFVRQVNEDGSGSLIGGNQAHYLNQNLLVLYRILAIFYAYLEAEDRQDVFQLTRCLLSRQLFRLATTLYVFGGNGKIDEKQEADIRKWRKIYGNYLALQPDITRLALNEGENTEAGLGLSFEDEAKMLLFYETKIEKLKKVANSTIGDRDLSDLLIRKYMLSTDDLWGVGREITHLVSFRNNGNGNLRNLMIRTFLPTFPFLVITSAILAILSYWSLTLPDLGWDTFDPPMKYSILATSSLCIFVAAWVMFIIIFLTTSGYWKYKLVYLLAIRVPAMNFVGAIAILGLGEKILKFAGGLPKDSLLIVLLGLLLPSLVYIFGEISTRNQSTPTLILRTLFITAYSYSFSVLIASILVTVTPSLGVISPQDISQPVSFVMIVGALLMMIGVFTQIFWEEKSLIDPL